MNQEEERRRGMYSAILDDALDEQLKEMVKNLFDAYVQAEGDTIKEAEAVQRYLAGAAIMRRCHAALEAEGPVF